MKKLRILLILCLTLAVTLPAASANSWNLNGQLLAMVEQTHDYDEYTGLVSDYNRKAATTHTILTSRYHNQLVAVDEVKDGWKDAIFSTTAVYQPSELDETGYPKITRTKSGFELAYPDIDERYYFELQHNNEGRTFYTLMEAQMGDVKVERIAEYIYQVTQGEESAVWPVGITLGSFNIHNMPKRGVEDVRRFNEGTKVCNTSPVCIRRWFRGRRAARSPMPCIPRRTRPLTARRRGKHPSARATIISCTSPWATGR